MQFWTWQAAKRRCNPAPWRADFHNARLMEAAVRDTRRKPAPWRSPNADRGGTWTCWNRTWCSWCDWTLASRAAVSNTVYISSRFAACENLPFHVINELLQITDDISTHYRSTFNELIQRVVYPVITSTSKRTSDDLNKKIKKY